MTVTSEPPAADRADEHQGWLRRITGDGPILVLDRRSDRVVVISTAHGLKFVDFKVKYHEMRLEGVASALPNPPIELPASYQTVRDEMLRQIEQRFGS